MITSGRSGKIFLNKTSSVIYIYSNWLRYSIYLCNKAYYFTDLNVCTCINGWWKATKFIVKPVEILKLFMKIQLINVNLKKNSGQDQEYPLLA